MPLDNRTCFKVNLRDRLSCRLCGKQPVTRENYHRGFEYHHVVPKSAGGTDDTANIVLLCHDCHQAAHRKTLPAIEAGAVLPLACHNCAASQNPETVEMNCGWYRCDACREQVHLYDHFFA